MSPEAFQSQIRDSQISELLDQVTRLKYRKYLRKVNLLRVRGFDNQIVSFDFPVTALVGPNGGGKTTILGAGAIAYKDIRPRRFFAKSGKYDMSMADWKMEYEFVDRDVNAKDTFRRTAAFLSQKWSRDALDRPVVFFGVARTVPANERAELQRCVSNNFEVAPERVTEIQGPVVDAVGKILGKDISRYTHLAVNTKGTVSLLTGANPDGVAYSEFHFGAGESSIIRMVMKIESLPKDSLILIEEIENGLHPVATVRMVEYLVEVAERKASQAIFTTHSNAALAPLPSQAIWASIDGKVYQGKLDIAALRAISGQIDAHLAIFCEDEFAAAWIQGVLRARTDLALEAISIHAMRGDGTAVQLNRHHNLNPTRKFPSVCFLDGDSQQNPDATEGVYRFPGRMPETEVFDGVMDKWGEIGGVLAVRLHRPFEAHGAVRTTIDEIRRANRDPHLLFSQVGKALGFLPESTARDAFVSAWTESHPTEANAIMQPIESLLPILTRASA